MLWLRLGITLQFTKVCRCYLVNFLDRILYLIGLWFVKGPRTIS